MKIYTLEETDIQVLQILVPAIVLSVENQNEKMVLYALVEPDNKKILNIEVRIVGTGHPADDVLIYKFIGTVKLFDGNLMFHIFTRVVNGKQMVEPESESLVET